MSELQPPQDPLSQDHAQPDLLPQRTGPASPAVWDPPGAPPWSPPSIPYPPPENRLRGLIRRYGTVGTFLGALVLGGVLVLSPQTSGNEDLKDEELLRLAQPSERGARAVTPMGDRPPGSGTALTVLADPTDATIHLNRERIGRTPLVSHALEAGTYTLTLSKEGFEDLDTLVVIGGGEREYVYAQLKPVAGARRSGDRRAASETPATPERRGQHGGLVVTSEPAGASIWLDEREVGRTPFSLGEVPAGSHTVALRLDGHAAHVEQVEVRAGTAGVVHATFGAQSGELAVIVRPWGSIYINDQLHQRETDTQYVVHLPVGTHRVRVVHPTLGSSDQVVRVNAGERQRLVVELGRAHAGGVARADGTPNPGSAPRTGAGTAEASDGAASDDTPESRVYTVAEKPPVLIGGLAALHRLARYPEQAYRFGLEGRVYLQFVVDETGQVQRPTVVRGLGMGCDEEALRVIRQARFEPATVHGKPVAVQHALFITFRRG